MSGRVHDVFISYSSKDKAIADAVCAKLESRRIRCWIAPRDIPPGVEYGQALIHALNGSRVFVLVFSSWANASKHVAREVERACDKELAILPFRVEDVKVSSRLEYYLSLTHWLDAITPPLDARLDQLADAVGRLLAVPGAAATDATAADAHADRPIIHMGSGISTREVAAGRAPSHPEQGGAPRPGPASGATVSDVFGRRAGLAERIIEGGGMRATQRRFGYVNLSLPGAAVFAQLHPQPDGIGLVLARRNASVPATPFKEIPVASLTGYRGPNTRWLDGSGHPYERKGPAIAFLIPDAVAELSDDADEWECIAGLLAHAKTLA